MQKKLQKYIDLLIEMAGSENNYEAIKEELNEVDKEIEAKKTELKNIKKSMKDDKYLKENDRIIDENIKIGLENKKQVYQYELDKTLKLINKASIDEEDNHQALTSVISRLKSLNALLDVLQDKLKVVVKDKELSSFYENMIEEVTKEVSELEKKKEILTKEYDKVRERLEYYGNNRSELDKKIDHLNIRLEDTLEALSTPNFYVDEMLKKKDENVVDELNSELESLENNRLTLITDPTYIGKEAMKMYNEEDYTSALASIKELVTIVKAKPYMNESKKDLNNLLKQAETTLDEFANNMDNNTYLSEDSKIIENRISYLEHELENINNEITNIKDRIVDIDKNIVIKISEELHKTEDLYHKLKEDYEEYKRIVLVEDDSISPRKKANLLAAYNHKKEEMDLVYNIFENYQNELEETIMNSQKLETVDLISLEKKKEDITEEIEELKKAKSNKTKAKDVLRMEKDKATLNQLSIDVDNIKHSQKYNKSADEIYKEIESLFSGESSEPLKEIETPTLDKKDFVNLDEFKIEEEQPVEAPVYETSPIINEEKEEQVSVEEQPKISLEEPVESDVKDNVSSMFEPVTEPISLEPQINELNDNIFKPEINLEEPVKDNIPSMFEPVTEPISLESQIGNEVSDNTFKPDEKILQAAEQNLEDTKVFPPRSRVIPSEERYKVINVEELPIKEKEEQEPSVLSETLDSSVLSQESVPSVLSETLDSSALSQESAPSVLFPSNSEPSVIPVPVESLEENVPVLETVPESLTSEPVIENNNSDYISFNDILNGEGYNGN